MRERKIISREGREGGEGKEDLSNKFLTFAFFARPFSGALLVCTKVADVGNCPPSL